jgi:hypothetical protein
MAQQHEASERAAAAADVDRRRFLQAGLAATGTVVAGSMLHSSTAAAAAPLAMTNTGPDQIPRKLLGRTGEQVSIIGLGGYHLGTMPAVDDAVRLVQEAVDVGGGQITPGDAAGVAPLFTDVTSSNLGLSKNVAIPYDDETTSDSFGVTPKH